MVFTMLDSTRNSHETLPETNKLHTCQKAKPNGNESSNLFQLIFQLWAGNFREVYKYISKENVLELASLKLT